MTGELTRRRFLQGAAVAAASGVLGLGALNLSGCSAIDEFFSRERVIIDHLGRAVTLPVVSDLKSVYFTSPLAQLFCFTLAPELLAGTSRQFGSAELEFLPEGTKSLDYLGTLSRGGVINAEALRIKNVQTIFSISGTDLTDVNINMGLELEKASGIPVFFIDGSFDRIGETYQLLGECLGRESRAAQLALYCEEVYAQVSEALALVPERELVRYYYAEGPEGLLTEAKESQHSLAFKVARGVNVAPTEELIEGRPDLVPVSSEQLIAWNPDIIITGYTVGTGANASANTISQADHIIRTNPKYSDISAVKNDRVVRMPTLPFAFCDRPPGVNRFLGIQWLANLFYPQYYDVDMVAAVREFYDKCYWRSINVEQAERILRAE
jgi:iron complex transport system substrate-binding protein